MASVTTTTAGLLVSVAVFVWGVLSARLERADLTAPIVFTVLGALLAAGGLIDAPTAPATLKPLVEVTLVWVLFADAARIRPRDLRPDIGQYVRLLGVGLPLTVAAGTGLAVVLLPGVHGWLALLVGAALAPTDAALGLPVVSNPAVPVRIRRLITVESGLNDGITAPVVTLAVAGAAAAHGVSEAHTVGTGLVELVVGAAVGTAVGGSGGYLLRWSRRRGWAAEDFAGVAVLALALASYATALTVSGNGFVAAFVGGLAFGAVAGPRGESELMLTEAFSGLVSLLVWAAFGAVVVPIMLERVSWAVVLYAVLSLTVVRVVPVALAELGSGLDRTTVLFIGWFGPRGLASLVFALLALEVLGPGADEVTAVIAVTVLLSVLAHGLSAGPVATRFGRSRTPGLGPAEAEPGIPVRGLPRRRQLRPR